MMKVTIPGEHAAGLWIFLASSTLYAKISLLFWCDDQCVYYALKRHLDVQLSFLHVKLVKQNPFFLCKEGTWTL
jgi:hypothetical protein